MHQNFDLAGTRPLRRRSLGSNKVARPFQHDCLHASRSPPVRVLSDKKMKVDLSTKLANKFATKITIKILDYVGCSGNGRIQRSPRQLTGSVSFIDVHFNITQGYCLAGEDDTLGFLFPRQRIFAFHGDFSRHEFHFATAAGSGAAGIVNFDAD